MNSVELHELLTDKIGLLPESVQNSISRTYFHQAIEWHPQKSTRVFRVLFDSQFKISGIQLCASSDNNNTVLVRPPFLESDIVEMAAREIEIIKCRQSLSSACSLTVGSTRIGYADRLNLYR